MKKVLSAILIVSILCSSPCITAAASDDLIAPQESAYLSSYMAKLEQGSAAGDINISYMVFAARTGLTQIGVSEIRIYSGGTRVKTIIGTVVNGLMITNDNAHYGTYTFHGEPGATYYAVVIVKAMDSAGSDSRSITTNTIVAPTR